MLFVVLEDICGLSVRSRDESVAPRYRFLLRRVQLVLECSLEVWHLGGVQIALRKYVSSHCVYVCCRKAVASFVMLLVG